MNAPQPHSPFLLLAWIVLGVVGTIALALVRDPARKRAWHVAFTVAAGLLFFAGVWYTSGGARNSLLFAGAAVVVIVSLSLWLVRMCWQCAALVYPRFFVPPTVCSRCGAPLRRPPNTG